MDFLNGSAMQDMLDEIRKATESIPDTQDQLMSLTGTAWSDDGMVKATVGPRGQLVDLDIDPRVFRKPDAQALRESVLSAATAAVRDISAQTREAIGVPPEVEELRARMAPGRSNPMERVLRPDADIVAERKGEDE